MEAKAATLSKAEAQMDKQTLISAGPKTEGRATLSPHIHSAAFSSPKLRASNPSATAEMRAGQGWLQGNWQTTLCKFPCVPHLAASPQGSLSIESIW